MIEAIIGLLGVIVGSAITITKDSGTSWRADRREGSYSAIRLIGMLEEYADRCLDVVYDDGTAEGRPAVRTKDGQEYHEAQVKTPDPLKYPDDIGWRSLPEALMHRTIALPNKARSTNRHIQASNEWATPPDFREFFGPRQMGYARLGLDALEIAGDLRAHFGISAESRDNLNPDWNPMNALRERISR